MLPSAPRSAGIPAQSIHLEPSIAVLPFANMSNDAENEYFCDGLAEELLNALAKLDALKVAARTSAFFFKDKNTNVGDIGRALGVNTILEGSVRKSGNRLRITVQLVNAADGYHLWSERYDRELNDIFVVQDEITLAVVDALKVKLLGAEKMSLLKHYTDNTEAYQLYLKGRFYWFKSTPESLEKSCAYFEQAIDIDPLYAPGYAGLSEFYGLSSAFGIIPPNEGWSKAEVLMAKAQELDNALPEVHNGLAAMRIFYHRDWRGAEREIARTIELSPRYAEVHNLYAFCLAALNRLDEAIAEGKSALALDPLSPRYSHSSGWWLYYARRYDEAIAQYQQTLELDPYNAIVYEDLANAYERQGRFDEAVAAWQEAMSLTRDGELATTLREAYEAGGFGNAVQTVMKKILGRLGERVGRNEYVPSIAFARAYVRLRDAEQAFHWLEKACEERNVFALLIKIDPFYDSLRPDPRFQALVSRLGLTQLNSLRQ